MKYYLVYLLLFVLGGAALAVALQSGRARNVKWLLGAAFCGAMGFYLWHVTVGEFVDYILGGYYHAGGAILDDPRSLYQGTSLKFVNLPLVAFIFTPLHGLTPLGGAQVLAACCAAAVAVFVALALRIGDALPEAGPRPQRELLLLWMCAAFGPLLYGIRLANITALLLPLMALALLVQPRRPAMTGALLAVCAVLKLPLLLFGPWLLVRHPRAGAGFWATLAALFALSVVLCGWDVNQDFIREVILEHVGTTFGAYNVQSISGTLAHLLPSNNLYVFTGVHRGLPFKAVQMAVTLVLLTPVAWYFLRGGVPRTPRAFQLEFGAVLCAALLISPLTWVHYYSLVLVPLAIIGQQLLAGSGEPRESGRFEVLTLLVAYLLLALPVVHQQPDATVPGPAALQFFVRHVLVSHYFAGAALLLGLIVWLRRAETRHNG